jgi:hypothetical protein
MRPLMKEEETKEPAIAGGAMVKGERISPGG